MDTAFMRTEALIGKAAVEKLQQAHVAVFGLGGVGSYALEALARAGIGKLTLVDNDTVSVSNINRQLFATTKTIGELKVKVAASRVNDINPNATIIVRNEFFSPESSGRFDFSQYDYVLDAIDSVTGKIELAVQCDRLGVPLISCMGTGNKLDATAFEVADIYSTEICPLARVMRRELKSRGIKKLTVVYSKEFPRSPLFDADAQSTRRQTPASISFVPASAGMILAGEVIKAIAFPDVQK